jgi:hypothetical protein
MIALQTIAQGIFLRKNMDYYFQIERLDILSGTISDTLHTALNGMTNKDVTQYLENYLNQNQESISIMNRSELMKIISKNGEWAESGDGATPSEYSLFNTFYQKQPNFLHYQNKMATFVLNPIIHYQQTVETGNLKQNLFYNSKGIEARGLLGKRVGFYTIFTDNQERGPLHHQNYIRNNNAVPGITYYKDFKTNKTGIAQDYLYAAGYIDADVIKNTVNVTLEPTNFIWVMDIEAFSCRTSEAIILF